MRSETLALVLVTVGVGVSSGAVSEVVFQLPELGAVFVSVSVMALYAIFSFRVAAFGDFKKSV